MSKKFPDRRAMFHQEAGTLDWMTVLEHTHLISQLEERLRIAEEALAFAVSQMERVQREIDQCRKTFPHIPMSPSLEDYSIQPIREALAAIKEKNEKT